MIVKDEAHVIARCLKSVKNIIDYWVIVDTGSIDNTIEIIKEEMKEIPGEVHQREWKNFGHNRTEALQLARGMGKYALIIDADEVLEVNQSFDKSSMVADSYMIQIEYGSLSYGTTRFLMNDKEWEYIGVIHNYPSCKNAAPGGHLDSIRVIHIHDGKRASDPMKTWKDVITLTDAICSDPHNPNSRYVFYLAQTYKELNQLDLAIHFYQKRADQENTWEEERWYAQYQVVKMKQQRGDDLDSLINPFLKVYEARPWRCEPLYDLCFLARRQKRNDLAYLFGKMALGIPFPVKDMLFVHKKVYDYLLIDELSIAAYYAKDYKLSLELCERLLREGKIHISTINRVVKNKEFAEKAIEQTSSTT